MDGKPKTTTLTKAEMTGEKQWAWTCARFFKIGDPLSAKWGDPVSPFLTSREMQEKLVKLAIHGSAPHQGLSCFSSITLFCSIFCITC